MVRMIIEMLGNRSFTLAQAGNQLAIPGGAKIFPREDQNVLNYVQYF